MVPLRILTRLAIVAFALAALIVSVLLWRGFDRVEALFRQNEELREAFARLTEEAVLAEFYLQSARFDGTGRRVLELVWMESAGEQTDPVRLERFSVYGDTVYLDGFLVQVPAEQVADGSGRALYFWRRAFGSDQKPVDGFPLDDGSGAPVRYAPIFRDALKGAEFGLFWDTLWALAHDPEALADYGFRAVFGNAVAVQPRLNFLYTIRLSRGGALLVTPRPLQPMGEG